MTSTPPNFNQTTTTYLRLLLRPAQAIWKAIMTGFIYIELIGGMVLMLFLHTPSSKKDEEPENSNVNHTDETTATTEPAAAAASQSPQRPRPSYLRFKNETLKKMLSPTSSWVPLISTSMLVLFLFRALEDYHDHHDTAKLSDSSTFHLSCPTSGRRTQTSAFVKLFAASVTTVCIHGHLGSLAGSASWRRELFRAVEVLGSPLSFLFSTSTSVWYEIASLPAFRRGPWHESLGLRYRLARMCFVRIESEGPRSSSEEPNVYLGVVNPVHVRAVPLSRDLKWSGRVLLLVIIFAQYVQAGVLLARRVVTHTAATVDMVMFFMVMSGLVALCQSITISLVNQSWVRASSATGIEPCVAKGCRLPECVAFKTRNGLPDGAFSVVVFGYDVSSLPRQLLHELAGGNLVLTILSRDKGRRESWWRVLVTLVGMHHLWRMVLSTVISLDSVVILLGDSPDGILSSEIPTTGSPNNGREAIVLPPIPTPATAKEKSSQSFQSKAISALIFVGFFVCGLVQIAFGLFAVVYNFAFVLWPCFFMYIQIVQETTAWKGSNETEGCPQLWKDGLEDELWWF